MYSMESLRDDTKLQEISLIVPTRNEGRIIEKNLKLIYEYLSKNFVDFEIIISDFSNDTTPLIVKDLSIQYPKIKYIFVDKKGIGIGEKAGMRNANFSAIMVYSIDMSWDIKCIRDSILVLSDDNVVLGSRGHNDSVVNRPLKRNMFSKLYNLCVNFFFGLNISDTQCVMAIRKLQLDSILDKLNSEGAFFQTEILIHAKAKNLKLIEIPVVVNDMRNDSKINPVRDGFLMFKEVVREYRKLNR